MASRVLSRPNHYELLGVDPGASGDEIMQAFASTMRHGQRSFGTATQIYAAFETLRDPGKRRAYDDKLGLSAKPSPKWTVGAQQSWAPSRAAPVAAPAPQPTAAAPEPEADPPVDPRVAAIAASLRQLAEPAPLRSAPDPKPAPEIRSRPRPQPAAEVEHVIEHILAVGHAEKHQLRFEASRAPGWKKPAVVAGALVVGVGLLGGLVGLTARNGEEAKPVAPTALEVSTPVAEVPATAQDRAAPVIPPQTEAPLPVAPVAGLPKPVSRPMQSPAPKVAEAPAVATTPDESAADPLASDPLAPAPVASAPTGSAMPLPKAVVARTIERIGYPCGEVTSTAAAEGSGPGVYTVTCSSGHSYQATPVHGRYHFRRMPPR